MPEGFEKTISKEEMADLITFLNGLESAPGAKQTPLVGVHVQAPSNPKPVAADHLKRRQSIMQANRHSEDYDVAVVGGGPAGLNAAVILGRACRRVVLFDHGKPRNYAARAVHGFLGLDGISPSEPRATVPPRSSFVWRTNP